MMRAFDHNGAVVSTSKPTRQLKTVKKVVHIDSADRDTAKYFTNGDFVVSLPRVYENVLSIRLKGGEFPPMSSLIPIDSASVQTISISASGIVTVTLGSTMSYYPGQYVTIVAAFDPRNNGAFLITSVSGVNLTIVNPNAVPDPSSSGVVSFVGCGALTHPYTRGQNYVGTYSSAADIGVNYNTFYFVIDIEGLNSSDETAVGANRSTFSDSMFAKIPAIASTYGTQVFIEYNDNSGQDNVAYYKPALGKLDRLHIRMRTHAQQDKSGFMYWTPDGKPATALTANGVNFSLSLEIEMLDNSFDEFSSFETRL